MTIEEQLAGKTSDQITNILTALEKERNILETNSDTVDNEISRIDRDILKLRERKKDLEDMARKGRQLVREKRLDIKIAEREFWRSRGR